MPLPASEEEKHIAKRDPLQVMRLDRMGSFHQSRLSFMRVLLRNLKASNWRFERTRFDLDASGVGVATYRAAGPKRSYTLVAFSHELPDELRSDRVIAEAWDATFALIEGEPSDEDIDRLSQNVPLQEAGRISSRELVLSRANKSVRLFNHVVDRLSRGQQPDVEKIKSTGYLMRTTAVYGSGKFGAADRSHWADREEFAGSFQPELLSVWLIRTFAADLVEHLASVKGGETSIPLDPELRRLLGIGNSTGLGMAPFLVNHPTLLHAWIDARETALARVRALPNTDQARWTQFVQFVNRAQQNASEWHSDHSLQQEKIKALQTDLDLVVHYVSNFEFQTPYPWDRLYGWAESTLSTEGQEQLVSLMFEPHGDLVDSLAATMAADESANFGIDGTMNIGQLIDDLHHRYGWAQAIDFDTRDAVARVWYTSQEKLEPRLGERFEEDIEPYEQPLAPGRDAMMLLDALSSCDKTETVARFLLAHPEHRHMVRRVQKLRHSPYGEICDNTIDAHMLPIDMLRCKLSFFGATRFDPRSDRWVRITMYQGAPYPDELADQDPDEGFYPSPAVA